VYSIICTVHRYSRSQVISGPVYAGKDRHNAEVAAFHLSVLLGLRRSPLTVGRKVNLRREVMPVATNDLLETFYQEGMINCAEAKSKCLMNEHSAGTIIILRPAYLLVISSSLNVLLLDCK
jgi:hypothetical protein